MPTKLWEKGKSANPAGKPKGAVSLGTKVKNDFFRVYAAMGGYIGFKKYIKENRQLWPQFYLKVLPLIMPKNVDIAGSIEIETHFTEEERKAIEEIKQRLANTNKPTEN